MSSHAPAVAAARPERAGTASRNPAEDVRDGIGPNRLTVGMFVTEGPLVSTVRIAAAAGADFLIFDGEHGVVDATSLRSAIALCSALGLDAVVRIPTHDSPLLAQALDGGARGVLAPNVETAADASELVERAFFPPRGRRGAAFQSAQDHYSSGSIADKIDKANRRTLVLCMIESPRGAENIDHILSVPGIAGCWFGYVDFTSFAGIPGSVDHPLVLAAAARVGAACRKHGKVAGVMTTSRDHLAPYLNGGFTTIAWGSEAFLLKQNLMAGIETCRAALTDSFDDRSPVGGTLA